MALALTATCEKCCEVVSAENSYEDDGIIMLPTKRCGLTIGVEDSSGHATGWTITKAKKGWTFCAWSGANSRWGAAGSEQEAIDLAQAAQHELESSVNETKGHNAYHSE